MRNTWLLTAAMLTFAAPAAFAQATSSPVAPPVASPSAMAPAEKAAPPMHASMAGKTMTSAEIRPGHEPGVGESFPASNNASNITSADTRSPIAPRLPTPVGGANATPAVFLADAQRAIDSRQTGRAQEALERAETAMLQRSVPADQANMPDQAQGVSQVKMARDALARGDMAGAKRAIAGAMSAT